MSYVPCILFRAKCFAPTPIHVIGGEHYEAIWYNRRYKTEGGATHFAEKQIQRENGVWQLPGAKRID